MRFPRLPDWIYPTLEPRDSKEIQRAKDIARERLATIENHSDPRSLSEGYARLHQDEMERLKSVESRLGGILRLAPITASLLLGGMFALLKGDLGGSGRWVSCAAAAALLYLNLQLACSTIAAVRGMDRTEWERPSIDDLVPAADLGPIALQRKVAAQICTRLQTAERNINYKVSQMAVAYAAIRNFAAGSALFAVLGFAAVGFQHPAATTEKAIGSDPGVPKSRYPQGVLGPQSPKGKPGVAGRRVQPVTPGPP